MRVSSDMMQYLDKHLPFGKAVEMAFPECVDDILEAHQCFAFDRYTSSIFHLGRAMEAATRKFAKKIKVKTPHRNDWQNWLTAINDHIKAMPFGAPKEKAKRLPLSEAAMHFFNFKEAIRNKTAHDGVFNTREQAIKTLERVLNFDGREIGA